MPAVGAIVFRDDAVLLVKRGNDPNQGRWSVPGGALETGETVEAATVRETLEETRVEVRPVRVFDVRDFIEFEGARVRGHYPLIDLLCEYVLGIRSPPRTRRTPDSSRSASWGSTTLPPRPSRSFTPRRLDERPSANPIVPDRIKRAPPNIVDIFIAARNAWEPWVFRARLRLACRSRIGRASS